MAALFREAPVGQVCRLLFGPRVFAYADEQTPLSTPHRPSTVLEKDHNSAAHDSEASRSSESVTPKAQAPGVYDFKDDIVDWYSSDDPDNPQNWTTRKKTFTFFQICLLTFAGRYPLLFSILPFVPFALRPQ